MTKIHKLWEVTKQTALDISSSGQAWQKFLSSAAYTSKYIFAEQVSIYAYKPEAKACASMEFWNKVFHRWVNKGAKGIPLPDFSENNSKINYVFDISDTHETRYTNREVDIWRYSDNYEEALKEILDVQETEFNIDLVDNIKRHIGALVEDLNDELVIDTGEINLKKAKILKFTKNSTIYMMFERMGLEPSEYFSDSDFSDITDFNNLNVLSSIGTLASKIVTNFIEDIKER
ncbi:MAG TPA: hypothetical protein GX708_22545 [Gallicola sp.]|nr:hypothetical protein [Gallicola sp.]